MPKLLYILGTRPEAIKLAPLILSDCENSRKFQSEVCLTGQHEEMLDQVVDLFGIPRDYDLHIMKEDQTLFEITQNALGLLKGAITESGPDAIVVQGDTTTAFAGALAAYYSKVPAIHIEAGLRSGNKYSPYPEEINRKLAGHLADVHFAPTEKARQNLLNEGIRDNVFVVGNTVIDALHMARNKLEMGDSSDLERRFSFVDGTKRLIFLTAHRRENLGDNLANICRAIRRLVDTYENVLFVYPVHLNPNVRRQVFATLRGVERVHLIEPLGYREVVWIMSKSHIILTDSGGIQEEAPSLKKPVLVLRNETERTEGIEAGNALLVGTETNAIEKAVGRLLDDQSEYDRMIMPENPYGDGHTSERVFAALSRLKNILR